MMRLLKQLHIQSLLQEQLLLVKLQELLLLQQLQL